MTKEDEQLERYLAEFRPRPIRKLVIPDQYPNLWLRRLAAAAIILLGAGIGLWLAVRPDSRAPQIVQVRQPSPIARPPRKNLSSFALTKLALENSQEFDSYLLNESRNVLPSLQGEHSTLRILAKE